MKKGILFAIAFTMTGFVTTAFAAEAQGRQGFIRAEMGRADLSIDGIGSDKDSSYGIGGGYWFNSNWGIEGSYNSLYDQDFENGSIKVQSIAVGAVAKKNFGTDGNGFYLGGRAGYSLSEARIRCFSCYYSSVTEESSGWYVGAGLGYDFTRNFGVGLNYTHYKAFTDTDADNLGLSGEYRF